MKKRVFVLLFSLLCCVVTFSQGSSLQQRADAEYAKKQYTTARSLYIQAYRDYVAKGQMKEAVTCGVRGTQLYYRENFYQESFDLLRDMDQRIINSSLSAQQQHALHYQTSKERMQMYMKLHRGESAVEHLRAMETHASASGDEDVKNDLLYNKAVYYYAFGQNAKGNAVFREMADKLTASKEYDKVDEVYRTLIANGRRSNSASLVAESYSSYMAWKDSVSALRLADQTGALKKQIADNEAAIAEKDSTLTMRMTIIVGLCVLAAVLAAVLVVGAVVLMRFVLLNRKQKKTIKMSNDNNALKSKFISNISAQLEPTLRKLDAKNADVQALLSFTKHIQTLSELESTADQQVELEDTQIPQFCESLVSQVRGSLKPGVTINVNAPKMSAPINKEYVSHILLHLLRNASEYAPQGGTIWFDFKKRGAHTHQFIVSNTGETIPEELREEVFKPFREIRDLAKGDGLGLPICRQMALKMNGDLDIDPQFTKGTRFVLDLHA